MSRLTIARNLLFSVLFISVGLYFILSTLFDRIGVGKPRADISEMTAEDFCEGQLVEGTVSELWDLFAYLEQGTKTLGNLYAFPLESSFEGTPMFAVLAVRNKSDISTAKQMMTEHLYGEDNSEHTEMEIKGEVLPLTGSNLSRFKQYVDDIGYSHSENVCAYMILVGSDTNDNTVHIIMGAAGILMGLFMLIFGVIGLIIARRNSQ